MIQRISELINRYRIFLITAHERLDGDALGSELALYHILHSLGKEVTVYNQDGTPENYRFLPGSDRIVHELPPLEPFEVGFILDCSELERVGREYGRIATLPNLANIDHHISNEGFCEAVLVDPLASSTGEMICRLVSHMGLAIHDPFLQVRLEIEADGLNGDVHEPLDLIRGIDQRHHELIDP